MKQGFFKILENKKLTESTYRMVLGGIMPAATNPGQFINIKLDGHFLRRPISICDTDEDTVTIIYKVLGHGTEEMTHLEPGTELDVLTGLGNGFDLTKAGDRPLLIGGGVGIPPLYMAAKKLSGQCEEICVVMGFNTAEEIYYEDEFKALGCRVVIATMDGSSGIKGTASDALVELLKERSDYTQFYTCGPMMMLRAVYRDAYGVAHIDGQLSFEERMGCGFGACMGCSVLTTGGYKRICKEGPVLNAEEIIWEYGRLL